MKPVASLIARKGIILFVIILTGCQNNSTIVNSPSPSIPVLADTPLPVHPLSGLVRRQISLVGPLGNSIKILAEIADEPEAQGKGLMGRDALGPYEGMLFIFPDEAPRGFWMKDTLIPLDILFFDATGRWVHGVTMVPCEADPCPVYDSHGLAKYALEMHAGFMAETEVGVGWKIVIER